MLILPNGGRKNRSIPDIIIAQCLRMSAEVLSQETKCTQSLGETLRAVHRVDPRRPGLLRSAHKLGVVRVIRERENEVAVLVDVVRTGVIGPTREVADALFR